MKQINIKCLQQRINEWLIKLHQRIQLIEKTQINYTNIGLETLNLIETFIPQNQNDMIEVIENIHEEYLLWIGPLLLNYTINLHQSNQNIINNVANLYYIHLNIILKSKLTYLHQLLYSLGYWILTNDCKIILHYYQLFGYILIHNSNVTIQVYSQFQSLYPTVYEQRISWLLNNVKHQGSLKLSKIIRIFNGLLCLQVDILYTLRLMMSLGKKHPENIIRMLIQCKHKLVNKIDTYYSIGQSNTIQRVDRITYNNIKNILQIWILSSKDIELSENIIETLLKLCFNSSQKRYQIIQLVLSFIIPSNKIFILMVQQFLIQSNLNVCKLIESYITPYSFGLATNIKRFFKTIAAPKISILQSKKQRSNCNYTLTQITSQSIVQKICILLQNFHEYSKYHKQSLNMLKCKGNLKIDRMKGLKSLALVIQFTTELQYRIQTDKSDYKITIGNSKLSISNRQNILLQDNFLHKESITIIMISLLGQQVIISIQTQYYQFKDKSKQIKCIQLLNQTEYNILYIACMILKILQEQLLQIIKSYKQDHNLIHPLNQQLQTYNILHQIHLDSILTNIKIKQNIFKNYQLQLTYNSIITSKKQSLIQILQIISGDKSIELLFYVLKVCFLQCIQIDPKSTIQSIDIILNLLNQIAQFHFYHYTKFYFKRQYTLIQFTQTLLKANPYFKEVCNAATIAKIINLHPINQTKHLQQILNENQSILSNNISGCPQDILRIFFSRVLSHYEIWSQYSLSCLKYLKNYTIKQLNVYGQYMIRSGIYQTLLYQISTFVQQQQKINIVMDIIMSLQLIIKRNLNHFKDEAIRDLNTTLAIIIYSVRKIRTQKQQKKDLINQQKDLINQQNDLINQQNNKQQLSQQINSLHRNSRILALLRLYNDIYIDSPILTLMQGQYEYIIQSLLSYKQLQKYSITHEIIIHIISKMQQFQVQNYLQQYYNMLQSQWIIMIWNYIIKYIKQWKYIYNSVQKLYAKSEWNNNIEQYEHIDWIYAISIQFDIIKQCNFLEYNDHQNKFKIQMLWRWIIILNDNQRINQYNCNNISHILIYLNEQDQDNFPLLKNTQGLYRYCHSLALLNLLLHSKAGYPLDQIKNILRYQLSQKNSLQELIFIYNNMNPYLSSLHRIIIFIKLLSIVSEEHIQKTIKSQSLIEQRMQIIIKLYKQIDWQCINHYIYYENELNNINLNDDKAIFIYENIRNKFNTDNIIIDKYYHSFIYQLQQHLLYIQTLTKEVIINPHLKQQTKITKQSQLNLNNQHNLSIKEHSNTIQCNNTQNKIKQTSNKNNNIGDTKEQKTHSQLKKNSNIQKKKGQRQCIYKSIHQDLFECINEDIHKQIEQNRTNKQAQIIDKSIQQNTQRRERINKFENYIREQKTINVIKRILQLMSKQYEIIKRIEFYKYPNIPPPNDLVVVTIPKQGLQQFGMMILKIQLALQQQNKLHQQKLQEETNKWKQQFQYFYQQNNYDHLLAVDTTYSGLYGQYQHNIRMYQMEQVVFPRRKSFTEKQQSLKNVYNVQNNSLPQDNNRIQTNSCQCTDNISMEYSQNNQLNLENSSNSSLSRKNSQTKSITSKTSQAKSIDQKESGDMIRKKSKTNRHRKITSSNNEPSLQRQRHICNPRLNTNQSKQEIKKYPCELIRKEGASAGYLILDRQYIQFEYIGHAALISLYPDDIVYKLSTSPCHQLSAEGTPILRLRVPYSNSEIFTRRYILRHTAIEIYNSILHNSYLFNLFTKQIRHQVLRVVSDRVLCIIDRLEAFIRSKYTKQWRKGIISNYDYLYLINKYSGRNFHDLAQYPVYPWTLCNFDDHEIDINNQANYRNLSLPPGKLGQDKFDKMKARMKELPQQEYQTRFLYGVMYSNPTVLYNFFIRIQPYTSLHWQHQGNKIDHADRLFSGIKQQYKSLLLASSDMKQLTPQFYYWSEFLKNINKIDLGQKQNKTEVNDIVLPNWSEFPEQFTFKMRQALQSKYVSDTLHQWIDLIWGYKAPYQVAEQHDNLYHFHAYEKDIFTFYDNQMDIRNAQVYISEFGQIPQQMFFKPHPPRNTRKPLSLDSCIVITKQLQNEYNIQNEESLISIQLSEQGIFIYRNQSVSFIETHSTLLYIMKHTTKTYPTKRGRNKLLNFRNSQWANITDGIIRIQNGKKIQLQKQIKSQNVEFYKNNIIYSKGYHIHIEEIHNSKFNYISTLYGHTDIICSFAIHTHLNVIFTLSQKGQIIIYQLSTLKFLKNFRIASFFCVNPQIAIHQMGYYIILNEQKIHIFSYNGQLFAEQDVEIQREKGLESKITRMKVLNDFQPKLLLSTSLGGIYILDFIKLKKFNLLSKYKTYSRMHDNILEKVMLNNDKFHYSHSIADFHLIKEPTQLSHLFKLIVLYHNGTVITFYELEFIEGQIKKNKSLASIGFI